MNWDFLLCSVLLEVSVSVHANNNEVNNMFGVPNIISLP